MFDKTGDAYLLLEEGNVMGKKRLNGTQESENQAPEKAVVPVRSVSGIPDGYDAAGFGVQYIVDEPSPDDAREYGV